MIGMCIETKIYVINFLIIKIALFYIKVQCLRLEPDLCGMILRMYERVCFMED